MKPSAFRVLLVTDAYPPSIGGADRAVQLLAYHLRDRGHTVAVASSWQAGLPLQADDQGIEVHRLRDATSRVPLVSDDPIRHVPPPFPDPEGVFRFRRLIRDFKPTIVHSYGWITYSCLAAVRGLDVAFVVSTRDYGNFCAVRTFVHKGSLCSGPAPLKCVGCAKDFYGAAKGAVATTSVLAGRRPLTSRIDGLHFNSTFVGETMKRHLLRLDAHAPVPVPSTVMPTFRDDSADGAPDRDVLARLPSVPFILFVGALRRVKGVHLLLDAYRRLEGAPPLVLMGTREIDSPDAFPEGVSVMESIPHGTVMAAWDRAMFGVFPSLWAEPLGNVVHEAMSRGRPVIGTRPGGHVDMIAEGETGLTVPSGDEDALVAAMQRMVDDGPLRERMGRAAEVRARLFTAEHAMPLMERLYAEAVEHRLKRRDR